MIVELAVMRTRTLATSSEAGRTEPFRTVAVPRNVLPLPHYFLSRSSDPLARSEATKEVILYQARQFCIHTRSYHEGLDLYQSLAVIHSLNSISIILTMWLFRFSSIFIMTHTSAGWLQGRSCNAII